MINLENTQANAVAAAINEERRRMGSPTVGMVLTLLILTDEMHQAEALSAASIAAREHPMRVIALIERPGRDTAHLDAQIQVGGDEGPGELIACRLHGELAKHAGSVAIPLLLPDTPVVAWWPGEAPDNPSSDPIGMHAQRRITDTNNTASYIQELGIRLSNYKPGDTDIAWTRTTPWRSMLAAALDQPVGRVQEVVVHSEARLASSLLLAGWLRKRLHVPTKIVHDKGPGITKVVLKTTQGEVSLSRPDGRVAQLSIPNAPESPVALPRRNMAELLAEELRRLDPDEIYLQALRGVDAVLHPTPKSEAKKAKAPIKSKTSAKSASSKTKTDSAKAKPATSSAKPKKKSK
ncbi:MAG: hypothetical protein EBS36_01235 [Actinobacteria bacterium]|nr:hypothetical protein [Actinomycetota bacterium]NBY15498.1 hypothetical protein [Actinomycetota bacterium]